MLASLHNLHYYLDFMGDVREAIASGRLAQLAAGVAGRYDVDATLGERLSPETPVEEQR